MYLITLLIVSIVVFSVLVQRAQDKRPTQVPLYIHERRARRRR